MFCWIYRPHYEGDVEDGDIDWHVDPHGMESVWSSREFLGAPFETEMLWGGSWATNDWIPRRVHS